MIRALYLDGPHRECSLGKPSICDDEMVAKAFNMLLQTKPPSAAVTPAPAHMRLSPRGPAHSVLPAVDLLGVVSHQVAQRISSISRC
jgi:hypothetical protein